MHDKWMGVLLLALSFALVLGAGAALGAEDSFELTIRNHRFEPEELVLPADQRVKLVIHNADKTPEEFESHDLNREKVIPGGGTVTIYVGPLSAGTYRFFGEFHEDTAKGRIVVR